MSRIATLISLLTLLSACGFHPRGGMPDDLKNKPVAIIGAPAASGGGIAMGTTAMGSNMTGLLTTRVQNAGGKVVTKVADADIVINLIKARHIRRPITLSAVGKANMFDLNYVVIYQVQDGRGRALSKQRELAVRREYFNTQASPLGQGLEEAQYRTEMEQDASNQLLRQVILILQHPEKVSQDESDATQPIGPALPESSAFKP